MQDDGELLANRLVQRSFPQMLETSLFDWIFESFKSEGQVVVFAEYGHLLPGKRG